MCVYTHIMLTYICTYTCIYTDTCICVYMDIYVCIHVYEYRLYPAPYLVFLHLVYL